MPLAALLCSCTIASLEDRQTFEDLSENMHLSAPCASWQGDDHAPRMIRRQGEIEERSKALGLHGAFERGAKKANDFLAVVELDCSDVAASRAVHLGDLAKMEAFLAERER